MIKHEVRVFFTALMFYTRIPCPAWVDHSDDFLSKATRYFPLIGWMVGLLCFAVYYGSRFIFPTEISILVSLLAGVLLTGAFHEDGFADVCDGFGGGWTKQRILEIMKDSRIGTYGVVGLIMLFALKFYAFLYLLNTTMSSLHILLVFVGAHALSRTIAISLVFKNVYVREEDSGKSKPVAHHYTWREVLGSLLFGLVPCLLLFSQHYVFAYTLIPLLILRVYLIRYFRKWIGGYTGDCLGATQQICETVFYLSIVAIWKFT